MDVAQGKYGRQTTPAAKGIIFKIFLIYSFEEGNIVPINLC